MLSLRDIFDNKIFRIPDYQRGYAWQEEQLEDLWRDIINLLNNERTHYMGMIGVEAVEKEKYKQWKGIDLKTHTENRFKFFHIVDGQQRFLTLTILLQAIIEQLPNDKKIYGDLKTEIIKKYLYREDIENDFLYLVGYEKDDPSYNYLIKKVFGHNVQKELINTAYTKNILFAKEYFAKQIKKLNKFIINIDKINKLESIVSDENLIKKITSIIASHTYKTEFKNETELFVEFNKVKISDDKIKKHEKTFLEVFKIDRLSDIYSIVTSRLVFNFNEFEEMEISMIFETMNKRGKPLSNLEMLKNRLIYLTSIFNINDDKKEKLRNEISKTWKTIYYYIGRNEKKSLNDDVFLRYHWILYHRFDRKETKFYENDIFRRIFIVIELQKGELKVSDISEYIKSIENTIKEWFKINYPYHEFSKKIKIDNEIAYWLNKFSLIGYRQFAPIMLTAMLQYSEQKITKEQLITFLKAVDSFIFLLYYVSGRRSNTGTYHFLNDANKLFIAKDGVNIDSVIEDINELWTYGTNSNGGYIDIDYFLRYIKDLFDRIPPNGKIRGYYDWGGSNQTGIKYLLFEYENSLLEDKYNEKIEYINYELEFIFPEHDNWNDLSEQWKINYNDCSDEKKRRLCYSLGNILLVEKRKNKNQRQDIKEKSFLQRKTEIYQYGSQSEIELCKYSDWTAQSILERGVKILTFMEERWNFKFEWWNKEKEEFLFIK